MITVDTSGVLASIDVHDPRHGEVVAAMHADPGPLVIPAGILGELGCLLEVRHGTRVLLTVLDDIVSGTYGVDCGEMDMQRVRHLIERYDDLPLGYADAAVVACAERRGGRVLTTDRRDFDVVAREGRITVVP